MALANSRTTQLGCGRDIDEVWANADSLPDAHELTWPDCQAARASLRELNAATYDLRSRGSHALTSDVDRKRSAMWLFFTGRLRQWLLFAVAVPLLLLLARLIRQTLEKCTKA